MNLGNPHEITLAELARTVLEITGSRSKLIARPLPPDDSLQRCPDISKARRLLDWEPEIGLREGLLKTIAYLDNILVRPLPSEE